MVFKKNLVGLTGEEVREHGGQEGACRWLERLGYFLAGSFPQDDFLWYVVLGAKIP